MPLLWSWPCACSRQRVKRTPHTSCTVVRRRRSRRAPCPSRSPAAPGAGLSATPPLPASPARCTTPPAAPAPPAEPAPRRPGARASKKWFLQLQKGL
ncbi:hypothetical protein FOCC_FOCC014159 [Frankliniella occidentalis]|nr:hypothetical protein FOCC_FOCC014159 [Frankliniella occidentalis]